MPPAKIGSLRIEDRIGFGGMGEVFRAYDEKRHRWVAVKTIRADAATDEDRRRRFRREAQAVAKLDHPCIVKVHEIIESEGGEIIVMELVEGKTLREQLKSGPLAPRRAIEIARDIAAGLSEAHLSGIVHRDLKAENIMLASGGQTKILDFGLAKGLWPDTESQLTADGILMGTTQAMSPEQARGHSLDPRSDLFSLGSLLYEMTTGASPFSDQSLLQTLRRICTFQQPNASDVRPGIAQSLSDFINHLLEKNPDHRPRNAQEVASRLSQILSGQTPSQSSALDLEHSSALETTLYDGMEPSVVADLVAKAQADTHTLTRPNFPENDLDAPPTTALTEHPISATTPRLSPWRISFTPRFKVALGIAGLVVCALLVATTLTPRLRSSNELWEVAVTHPKVETGAGLEGSDTVAAAARLAVTRGLGQLEGIYLLPWQEIDIVSGPAGEVAHAVAADEVVSTSLDCLSESCQVTLKRIRGREGRLVWTQTVDIPVNAFHVLDVTIAEQIARGYSEFVPRDSLPIDRPVPGEAFEKFLHLRANFDHKMGQRPAKELFLRLRTMRRRWPGFLETYLLEAKVAQLLYQSTGDVSYLESALKTLDYSERLAPAEPAIADLRFQVAFAADNLTLAEQSLDQLALRQADPVVIQHHRARYLERTANPRQALALLQQAVERRPSWNLLLDLAELEWRQGDWPAAKLHAAAAFDRAPESSEVQNLVALLESPTQTPRRAGEEKSHSKMP